MPQLRELDISKVSFVDRAAVRDPANPKEPQTFLFWKSEDGANGKETAVTEENKGTETDVNKGEGKEPDAATQLKGAFELISKNKGALTSEQKSELAKLTKAESDGTKVEFDKSELSPAARAYFEKQEADLAAARKDATEAVELAKAEALKVRKTEFLAKAEALPYVHPGQTPVEFGELLMKMADADPEAFKTFEAHQTAVNAQLAKSAIWSEIGSGQNGGGTAAEQVNVKATELMKSETGLTKEQAIEKVLEADPDLYTAYMDTRPAARR